MRWLIQHSVRAGVVASLTALMLTAPPVADAAPVGTAFTYQGRLKNAGSPANGLHDLRFRLYDASAGGAQVGATLCLNNVTVTGGLFTVTLDFGPQFNGEERFLEIDVRADTGLDCSNTTGFTTLAPRQPLSGTPYAHFTLDAGQLDGLDSAAFLQSVPNPLTLTGASNTHIIRGENASSFFQSAGVSGKSTAASGVTYGVHGTSASSDGAAVVGNATASTGFARGGQFYSTSGSGTGVEGLSLALSGATYGGRFECLSPAGFGGLFENNSAAAGLTVGLSGPHGAISTDGFLHREYTATTRSCAIPIAYGSISATGTVNSGTGNFTVSQPATGQYDITITGETYSNNTFTVTITPVTNSPRITGVADAGAGFRVNMWNLAGTLVDNAFHFTVWTTDPANPG